MKKLNLKEIQFEEKEMLKILIEVFNKNNINYYLWGGTFLGAVRHGGFIPWDDDIDIILPRPEYNKFISIIRKNKNILPNNLEFAGFEIGKDDYPFIKLINKNIIIKDILQWDKYLWIDIFPLDGVPEKYKIYYKIRKIRKHLYNLYRYKANNFVMNKRSLSEKIKIILFKFIKKDKYAQVIKNYIEFCSKYDYNKSKYVCDNIWCGNTKYYLEKEKIQQCETYEFEDIKVNGFKNYDYVLHELYGDYMKLPPEDQRVTHSFEAWKVEENEE